MTKELIEKYQKEADFIRDTDLAVAQSLDGVIKDLQSLLEKEGIDCTQIENIERANMKNLIISDINWLSELLISFSQYLYKRNLLNVIKKNIPIRVKLFLKRKEAKKIFDTIEKQLKPVKEKKEVDAETFLRDRIGLTQPIYLYDENDNNVMLTKLLQDYQSQSKSVDERQILISFLKWRRGEQLTSETELEIKTFINERSN